MPDQSEDEEITPAWKGEGEDEDMLDEVLKAIKVVENKEAQGIDVMEVFSPPRVTELAKVI